MASPVEPSFSQFSPDKIIAITKASQTPDPDRAIRIARAEDYPNRAWFCVAAFIGFVSLCHFIALAHRLTRRTKRDREPAVRGSVSFSRLPSAMANAFRALAFRSTVPIGSSYTLNVAELFLTAAYIVIIFVWSLVNTTSKKGVRYDPKYWGNMAGNLASEQLPLMTVLGTKNNIISYVTGVSFDKLGYLHRMTARVLCVLLWVHAAGRIKVGMAGSFAWWRPWIQCGMLASVAFSILCIVSIRPLRDRHYEVFKVVHFLMAFITLLAGYFHAQGILVGYYVWPAFVIWGLDRLLRAIRIVAYNIGYFKNGSKEQFGRIDVLSQHFLRITIRRPTYMHWLPGQSVYLTIPEISPFEAHPFTISTIDVPQEDRDGTSEGEDVSSKSSRSDHREGGIPYKQLVFLARVRSGFTKRLLNGAGVKVDTKVILDGPYSSPPLIKGFETAVFIAGGSGVAFTLPLFLELLHRESLGKNDCTKIVFIWAIRDVSHINWIADALVPAISRKSSRVTIDVRVYVTTSLEDDHDNPSLDDDSMEADEEAKVDNNNSDLKQVKYPGVNIEQGRPDLKRVADEIISEASGAISFNVCGTLALANTVRSVLRPARFMDVLRGGPTVTLHIESFGNA